MRKIRFVFVAAIAAFMLVAGSFHSAYAQDTNRPFASGIQVQNLGSSEADITVEFFPENDGTAAVTFNDTIAANDQVTYAVLDGNNNSPNLPANFRGSAVISSDQQVAAIVNIVSPDISLSFGGEAYIGADGGSTEVSLPLLFKNASGFSTFFNVQNASSTAANVTVTYTNNATEQATIPPNASVRFDQSTNADLPDGFAGGATITSDQDVVAAAVQVGTNTVLAYNGLPSGSSTPVFPIVNTNNANFITGISLQNRGDTATDVTISYTPSQGSDGPIGTACTETQTIEPGGDVAFFAIDAFRESRAGEDCADGALFVGSARVTANSADQELVAIVNQLNQQTNKAGTYTSFDPGAASDTIVYPLIQDRVGGFFTGLSMLNVGGSETTITCEYSNTSVTQAQTVAPNEAFTITQINEIGDLYNGSGTCTASGGEIVGIANQLLNAGTADTFFVYEGTNN